MKENSCCFFGHRTINETDELRTKLIEAIEELIIDEKVDTFLFGSHSEFDRLCLSLVSLLKGKYPHIKRIYVRAMYHYLDDFYYESLMKTYDETYYPEKILGSGRAAYVERNYEMINNSKYCIVYYDEQNAPTTRKSGTKIALDYAIKKGREVILI